MTEKIASAHVSLKRAYEPAAPDDGLRILVDRLWPRGLSKSNAAVDHWFKDLAPSSELRRWFAHDPALWDEFRRRYVQELRAHPEPLRQLRALAREGPITLVYAARDETHNNAVALKECLLGRAGRSSNTDA